MALYDDLAQTRAARLLTADAEPLLAAMDLITSTLARDHIAIRATDPDDPAALVCLGQYFALLSARVEGVTMDTFPLPDPGAARYRPPHGTFLIAWADDLPVGCVSLRAIDGPLAEVKRLWVAPNARGHGLARRLMLAIEDQARNLGYNALTLDTNAALTDAITLYRKTGWSDIAPYSGIPSTHWFGKAL